MKKILLSILSLSAAAAVWAAPLTPNQALSRAISSDRDKIVATTAGSHELCFTKAVDGKPMIYVFSSPDREGFLAVAADDTTIPLLGYSDSGILPATEEELPDGMRYWLNSLAEQAAVNASRTDAPRATSPRAPRVSIKPLMTTKWNQSEPYNNLCPTLNGSRCVTGCVATAFAQVLKYHNFPAKGTGTYSYTWEQGNQTLSFDYGATTFDWNNMLDTYDSGATTAQKNAVATLMRACGIGVEMSYSPSESGAPSINLVRALLENFGYDKGLLFMMRDYYTISEWEDIIYTNLLEYGPVLYAGQSNDGAHQFVCDGYSDGLFHFNWGWGGMSDGFFSLNALDPGSQGIGGSSSGYDFNQNIISYVKPESGNSEYSYQMYADGGLSVNATEINQGETVEIGFSARNYSSTPIYDTYMGVSITPAAGGKSNDYLRVLYEQELGIGWGFNQLTAKITIAGYADGVYKITPVFKVGADGEVLPIKVPVTDVQMIYMTVNGDKVTFSLANPADVSASNLTLESALYKGSDFKVSATLANTSDDAEFYGTVAVALVKDGEMAAIGNDALVNLAPGETRNWEYVSPLRYFTSNGQAVVPAAGKYQMILYKKSGESYEKISAPVEVTLHNASTPTLQISNLKIDNNQDYWDISAEADLKCTSGYFAGNIDLYIFPYVEGQSVYPIGRATSEFVAIAAPGVATAPERAPAVGNTKLIWHINLANGEPGAKYFASAYLNNAYVGNRAVFTVSSNINTGVDEIPTEDASPVTRTLYYTMTGVALGENCPESGIFIVVEQHADGSVTTRKVLK